MRNLSQSATQRARKSRKNPSVAEDILWAQLRSRKHGFKFRREYPVGPFRADFYCAEARLVVELDGEQHDPARDAVRDAYFRSLGLEVLRIPNTLFFKLDPNKPLVGIQLIIETCERRIESFRPSSPAPRGFPPLAFRRRERGRSKSGGEGSGRETLVLPLPREIRAAPARRIRRIPPVA